jgi:hypothetical protein
MPLKVKHEIVTSTHLVNTDAGLLIRCTERDGWNHSACLFTWIRPNVNRTSAKPVHMSLDDRVSDTAINSVDKADSRRHRVRDGGSWKRDDFMKI